MERLTKRNEHGGIVSAIEKTHSDVEKLRFMRKLAAYEEAEADGRLVILPCMVGDMVYVVTQCGNIHMHVDDDYINGTGDTSCPFENQCPHGECDIHNVIVAETLYEGYIADGRGNTAFLENIANVFPLESFGKTVFLTREEAEQALKKSGSLPCGRKSQCNEPEDSELCTQCRKNQDGDILNGSNYTKLTVRNKATGEEIAVITNDEITTANADIVVALTPKYD